MDKTREICKDILDRLNEGFNKIGKNFNEEEIEDKVHSPSHYRLLIKDCEFEVIDLIKGVLDNSDVDNSIAFNWGNALKYLLRWTHKNGVEDLKKCRVYLDWMIDTLEEDK